MAIYYMRADGTATKATAVGPATDPSKCMSVATHNATTFDPGDTILLTPQGGEFRAHILPPSMGTPENRIIYMGDPVSISKPVINAADPITSGLYKWSMSVLGNNTFFVTLQSNVNPNIGAPVAVYIDDKRMAFNATELLHDGQFWYGDADQLGFNTIYIRDDRGNPDDTGVKIENSIRTYCFGSNLVNSNQTYKNMVLKNARIRAMAWNYGTGGSTSQSENMTVEGIDFFNSPTLLYIRNGLNCKVLNNTFNYSRPNPSQSTRALEIIGSLVSTVDVLFNKFYNTNTYAIYYDGANDNNILNLINDTIFHCNNSIMFIVSTAKGVVNFINTLYACRPQANTVNNRTINNASTNCTVNVKNSWVGSSPILPKTEDIRVNYLSANKGFNLPLFLKCPRKGTLAVTFDDAINWVSIKDFYIYANSLGIKLDFCIDQTNNTSFMTSSFVSDVQAFLLAGNGISSHTRSHSNLISTQALTIRYTGGSEACLLSITGFFLTTDCTNPADNLSVDLRNYNSMASLQAFINSQELYTCAQVSTQLRTIPINPDNNALILAVVNAQNIKTTYTIDLNVDNFLHYELVGSKTDLENLFGIPIKTLGYPFGRASEYVKQKVQEYGYEAARLVDLITENPVFTFNEDEPIDLFSLFGLSIETAWDWSSANGVRRGIISVVNLISATGDVMTLYDHNITSRIDRWYDICDVIGEAVSRGYIEVKTLSDVAGYVKDIGTTYNDRVYHRFNIQEEEDFRLFLDSELVGAGDPLAVTSIPNLYTIDGRQITDETGAVIGPVHIGAYGIEVPPLPPSNSTPRRIGSVASAPAAVSPFC